MSDHDECERLRAENERLTALLRAAPPMRSIGDPRYQAWKKRVDDSVE